MFSISLVLVLTLESTTYNQFSNLYPHEITRLSFDILWNLYPVVAMLQFTGSCLTLTLLSLTLNPLLWFVSGKSMTAQNSLGSRRTNLCSFWRFWKVFKFHVLNFIHQNRLDLVVSQFFHIFLALVFSLIDLHWHKLPFPTLSFSRYSLVFTTQSWLILSVYWQERRRLLYICYGPGHCSAYCGKESPK